MRVIDMAKKSDEGKDSRSAKTGQSAVEIFRAKHAAYYESIAKVIPRMHYNARTGMLRVGSYRRVSPHMKVTKKR